MNDELKARLTKIVDYAIPGAAYEADEVSQMRREYFIGSIVDMIHQAYSAEIEKTINDEHNYMLGREWYNRFRDELRLDDDWQGAVNAAKRAAGLEPQND